MSLTEPTDEKIDMKFVTHTAVHTIDGKLPMSIVNEVNEYVDEIVKVCKTILEILWVKLKEIKIPIS